MSDSILSDQLWQRTEPLLPQPKKRRNVQHAGRKPADPRSALGMFGEAAGEGLASYTVSAGGAV